MLEILQTRCSSARSGITTEGPLTTTGGVMREVVAGFGLAAPCVLFAALFSGPGSVRLFLVVAGLLCLVSWLTSESRVVLLLFPPIQSPEKGQGKRRRR